MRGDGVCGASDLRSDSKSGSQVLVAAGGGGAGIWEAGGNAGVDGSGVLGGGGTLTAGGAGEAGPAKAVSGIDGVQRQDGSGGCMQWSARAVGSGEGRGGLYGGVTAQAVIDGHLDLRSGDYSEGSSLREFVHRARADEAASFTIT